MRRGQNPAKFVDHVATPERITLAVLCYIPFLSGFHEDALEVLDICLTSLQQNTPQPYDLLVFDNGSCEQVVEYLRGRQREQLIQYLILSQKNLGKGGAWNIIFEAAPGEILAYCDSDAEFSPGWLEASLAVLETYPDVGMVTSRPFRTDPSLYSATLAWADQTPEVSRESGQFIPWEDFRAFDRSLGQSEDEVRARYENTADMRLTYRDLPAFAGASHWQFVARKQTLRRFLPFSMDRPMGQVRELDHRVNQAGLLRLMTAEPYAMNLSNTPPAELQRTQAAGPPKPALRQRLLELPWVKRVLLYVYNRIFHWYYSR